LTQLILVRHGQTAWNREPHFRGRADIELDETGLVQAQATANRLSRFSVTAIYSSPLKRALTTAQAIADKFGLTVQPHNGLLDIYFGKWQGLTPQEASDQDGVLLDAWRNAPHKVTFPQGEGLTHVRDRVTSALDELTAKHADETIVLVSHVVVLKVLLCVLLGLDDSHFWKIAQDTCAINIIKVKDGNYIVSLINDTCHLNE
jgi:broad specificity phosphatase PhoE